MTLVKAWEELGASHRGATKKLGPLLPWVPQADAHSDQRRCLPVVPGTHSEPQVFSWRPLLFQAPVGPTSQRAVGVSRSSWLRWHFLWWILWEEHSPSSLPCRRAQARPTSGCWEGAGPADGLCPEMYAVLAAHRIRGLRRDPGGKWTHLAPPHFPRYRIQVGLKVRRKFLPCPDPSSHTHHIALFSRKTLPRVRTGPGLARGSARAFVS